MIPITSGLPPIIYQDSRVLLLGSYPSIISLQTGEYYANPRNMFWDIMEDMLGVSRHLPYWQRINALLSWSIGLWDVYATCERSTSADVKITSPVPNDIRGIIQTHPDITIIFLNGREAEKGFSRFFPDITIQTHYLPSSSPAHAISRKDKTKQWMKIVNALSANPGT